MTEKRYPVRHRKRLSVRFGIGQANRVAFTEDLSMSGMFIRSLNVCPPNTRLLIDLLLEDENRVVLEARVMWARKVPQNLFHLARKCGMGVRILHFLSGEEHFRRVCDGMRKPG